MNRGAVNDFFLVQFLVCTWSLRAQPKELLCVADVRKIPHQQSAANWLRAGSCWGGYEERSWRRTLSPTLSGSQSRAWLCVNAAKIVWRRIKGLSGAHNFGPHSWFLFARLGDVHRNRSALLQPLPHIGFLCKEKVASVPPRNREMRTAADTDSSVFWLCSRVLRSVLIGSLFLQLAKRSDPVRDYRCIARISRYRRVLDAPSLCPVRRANSIIMHLI